MGLLAELRKQHPSGVLASTLTYVSMAAASATAATIYTPSTGKRFYLVQLKVWHGSAQMRLQLGEGVAGSFVQRLPDLTVMSLLDNLYTLDAGDFPARVFEAAMTAATAVAASATPNDMRLGITVLEF